MNLHIQPIQIKDSDGNYVTHIYVMNQIISLPPPSNVASYSELFNEYDYSSDDIKFNKLKYNLHYIFNKTIVGKEIDTFLCNNCVQFKIQSIVDLDDESIAEQMSKYLLKYLFYKI
jgi:hypothetical protein